MISKGCKSDEFFCVEDNTCIDNLTVCDEHKNCSNGTDESYSLCGMYYYN